MNSHAIDLLTVFCNGSKKYPSFYLSPILPESRIQHLLSYDMSLVFVKRVCMYPPSLAAQLRILATRPPWRWQHNHLRCLPSRSCCPTLGAPSNQTNTTCTPNPNRDETDTTRGKSRRRAKARVIVQTLSALQRQQRLHMIIYHKNATSQAHSHGPARPQPAGRQPIPRQPTTSTTPGQQ